MDQGKAQTIIIDMASAEAASTVAGGRTEAAGDAIITARGPRGGTSRPKQAGKGETTDRSDRRGPKPLKAKAKADDAAGSEAKAGPVPAPAPAPSKLNLLVALLRTPGGATLPELQSATGWQVHSVRGTMAGALRKKGYTVISEKPGGGLRHYRIDEAS